MNESIQSVFDGLSTDLRRVGFKYTTLPELIKCNEDYSASIPIILKWLRLLPGNSRYEMQFQKALSVSFSKPIVARILIEEFKFIPIDAQRPPKVPIAAAIANIADRSFEIEIRNLLLDKGDRYERLMPFL